MQCDTVWILVAGTGTEETRFYRSPGTDGSFDRDDGDLTETPR